MAVVFYITMLISGQWLEFSYTRVLLVLLLGIPALAGIGLIFSGFILLNKRFGSFLQIFTFALAAVIALPAPPADFDNVYSYLPFASAAYAAREIMTGTITSDIPGSWYLYIGGVSAIYLLIGFIVFSLLENRAKSLALLGQY
jgi:ABC-2 type transport system permease protein